MKRSNVSQNAWREILARIFEDCETQYNLSPKWLINPETNRPLKLNMFYPEIGVAVRILGLRARQQKRRMSLEEELQAKQRERARQEACEAHGVSLANIDIHAETPQSVFVAIELALSQASQRVMNDDQRSEAEKVALREKISLARSRASDLNRRIKSQEGLNPYYDLWVDREFAVTRSSNNEDITDKEALILEEGMPIEHHQFGLGIIHKLESSGDDTLVTIDFGDEGQRTFMASLLADKVDLD